MLSYARASFEAITSQYGQISLNKEAYFLISVLSLYHAGCMQNTFTQPRVLPLKAEQMQPSDQTQPSGQTRATIGGYAHKPSQGAVPPDPCSCSSIGLDKFIIDSSTYTKK